MAVLRPRYGEIACPCALTDAHKEALRESGLEHDAGRHSIDTEESSNVAIDDLPRPSSMRDDRFDLLSDICL